MHGVVGIPKSRSQNPRLLHPFNGKEETLMGKSFPSDQNLAVFVLCLEMGEVNVIACNGSPSKSVLVLNKLF